MLAKVQDQEARVAAVQEAEAITALFHGLEWPGVAVDHDHVAKELGIPDRGDIARVRDEKVLVIPSKNARVSG